MIHANGPGKNIRCMFQFDAQNMLNTGVGEGERGSASVGTVYV